MAIGCPPYFISRAGRLYAGGEPFVCALFYSTVTGEWAKLIADLDNEDSEIRDQATQVLMARCHSTEPELRAELARTKSAEAMLRLKSALAELPSPVLSDPEILRRLRAVYALRRSGGEAARKALEKIAGAAPMERVKEAAQWSAQRMAKCE